MRPASGQGGSMAFEDCAILCRVLETLKEKQCPGPTTKAEVERALQDYERQRLPRVRKLWKDQWDRSESSYNHKVRMEPWTPEFSEWVFNGV